MKLRLITPKRRNWLLAIAAALVLIGVLAWQVNWRDWGDHLAIDYFVLEDAWKGPFMPEIDEVEVVLLKGTKNQSYDESKIDEYVSGGSRTVTGQDAQNIADMWRMLPRNPKYGMLCFGPVYGLRFRDKGKLILETTICWHCNHYTLSPTLFGGSPEMAFDGESKVALTLLDALKRQVPMK